ncbi:MAG: DUF2846 domain-containing protein [Chitinophagaceae bacterium]|nr:DUF2846 domain-containing protein [Chitinophagaceae bacterium]
MKCMNSFPAVSSIYYGNALFQKLLHWNEELSFLYKYRITAHFLLFVSLFSLSVCNAQNRRLYEQPPKDKARVFFLYDMEHPRTRTYDPGFTPIFINEQLACRLKTRTYTYIDIHPGNYQLASQFRGKKYKFRNAQTTELDAEAGKIYYFELVEKWLGGLSFRMDVERRRARELEEIIEQKRTIFIDETVYKVPEKQDPIFNKRFFIRVPVTFIVPAGNYKNWWVSELRPAVNRFQPLSPGFEIGVKLGEQNHFLSWGFINSTQPSVVNPNSPTVREHISLNFNTLYYSYAVALDDKNMMLLYPKAGISSLNYVLESRVDGGGGGSEGVGGFGMNAGIQFEYRLGRTFSIDTNWEYLNGTSTFKGDKINLNQHRFFIGIRVQF